MKLKSLLLSITIFTGLGTNTYSLKPANAVSIFSIGNSLTWDSQPELLDGTIGHHIGCSKNLQQIYSDPEGSACVTPNMGTWDVALSENSFDYVTVQPHFGTTLEEDTSIINEWMEIQPSATFVIHTGWTRPEVWEENRHNISKNPKVKSLDYYPKLMKSLALANPGRKIVTTNAFQVLNSIYEDIKEENAPFSTLSELFRDQIHMDYSTGRYLIHNLMRQALDQPTSNPLDLESGEIKTYLDNKITEQSLDSLVASDSGASVPFEFSPTLGLLTVGGIFTMSKLRKIR